MTVQLINFVYFFWTTLYNMWTNTIWFYSHMRRTRYEAGKAKAGMVHSVSGWMRGVQVKLWNPLRTRAIPQRLRGVFTTRRCTNPRLPLPYLTTTHLHVTSYSLPHVLRNPPPFSLHTQTPLISFPFPFFVLPSLYVLSIPYCFRAHWVLLGINSVVMFELRISIRSQIDSRMSSQIRQII